MKARKTTACVLVIAAWLWIAALPALRRTIRRESRIANRLEAAARATLAAYPNADLVQIDDFTLSNTNGRHRRHVVGQLHESADREGPPEKQDMASASRCPTARSR